MSVTIDSASAVRLIAEGAICFDTDASTAMCDELPVRLPSGNDRVDRPILVCGSSAGTHPDRHDYVSSPPTFTWNKQDTGNVRQSKIACATADLCSGATTAGGVFTYDHGTCAPASVDVPDAQVAACARSQGFCAVAGGTQMATYDGTTFSSSSTVDVGSDIVDVSCGGVGDCVVIGQHDAVEVADCVAGPMRAVDDAASLTSVSCPSPSFCMAVDDSGQTSTFDGSKCLDLVLDGAKSAYTDRARPGFDGDVSCRTATACVALVDGVLYRGTGS